MHRGSRLVEKAIKIDVPTAAGSVPATPVFRYITRIRTSRFPKSSSLCLFDMAAQTPTGTPYGTPAGTPPGTPPGSPRGTPPGSPFTPPSTSYRALVCPGAPKKRSREEYAALAAEAAEAAVPAEPALAAEALLPADPAADADQTGVRRTLQFPEPTLWDRREPRIRFPLTCAQMARAWNRGCW